MGVTLAFSIIVGVDPQVGLYASFSIAVIIALKVMGAYGHSRIREFFVGSNTTRMIGSSRVLLLLLR